MLRKIVLFHPRGLNFSQRRKVAYITYGPCTGTEDPMVNKICVLELLTFLKGLGVMVAIVGLPYNAHCMVAPWKKAVLYGSLLSSNPTFLETTLIINLAKEPQTILAAMRASTRRNIRSASRKGMTFVEVY